MDHLDWPAHGDEMSVSLPLSQKGWKTLCIHNDVSVSANLQQSQMSYQNPMSFLAYTWDCKYRRCFEDSCSQVTQRYTKSHWAYFRTVHVLSDGYDRIWRYVTWDNLTSTGSKQLFATILIWFEIWRSRKLWPVWPPRNTKSHSKVTSPNWFASMYIVKASLSLSLAEWEDLKMYRNFSTVIKAVKASKALDSPKIGLGGGLCFSGSTGWPNRIFWIRQDHEARIWNVLWWGKCYPKRSVIAHKLL